MIKDRGTELLHTLMEVVTRAHSRITSGTAWARLLSQTEVTTSAHGKMMLSTAKAFSPGLKVASSVGSGSMANLDKEFSLSRMVHRDKSSDAYFENASKALSKFYYIGKIS